MSGCKCGHDRSDHTGPIGDCASRCLCDLCPDGTANDCWCAGFKPVDDQTYPPEPPSAGLRAGGPNG